MAQFSARLRGLGILPRVSMRDIYLNPTIRRLAVVLATWSRWTPSTPLARSQPCGRGSSAEYVLCGDAAGLLFLAATYLGVLLLDSGYGGSPRRSGWRTPGTGSGVSAGTYRRCACSDRGEVAAGRRLAPGEIRIWSTDYLRFWLIKVLIQANPLAWFAGSPMFVWYLRALGARIGRGVTIHSRNIPVATDLITIGDGAVIRKTASTPDTALSPGHTAGPGHPRPPHLCGGEDRARRRHPDGRMVRRWGTPRRCRPGRRYRPVRPGTAARPNQPPRSTRTVPPARCSSMRKIAYTLLQLVGILLPGSAVMALVGAAGPTCPRSTRC